MHTGWADLCEPWQAAFEQMWEAYVAGAFPVGAVIVDADGAIVACGRNRIGEDHVGMVAGTRLAHAEINALTQLPATSRYRDHTIYTTLEPCLLCYGALSMCRVGAIHYAAADPYSGACHVPIEIPVVRNAPITVEGPLDGWPGLLSQTLAIACWHTDGQNSAYRVIEQFSPEAHESAARLLELDLDHDLSLPELLPELLTYALAL